MPVADVTTDAVPGPADDFTSDVSTQGTVGVGFSVTGEIEVAEDRDWVAVVLVADTNYRFDLKGSVTGDGTLADPYLYGIRNADGDLIADTKDDDGGSGSNSRVFHTAAESGTYYVVAGAYSHGRGTYTLSVTQVDDVPRDDYQAGTGTTGTVDVGGSTTGRTRSKTLFSRNCPRRFADV